MELLSRPDNRYYEQPYVPSPDERSRWKTWPLRPVEAHTLLVNNVGRLTQVDASVLRYIADSDDFSSDDEIDFFSVQAELGLMDDA